MTTGELRDRVTIEQNTPSTNTQGGRTASWGTLATVWASVVPARAGEALQLREFIGSTAAYVVTIRNRGDVTPKMRVSWTPYGGSAKTLEIHGVQPAAKRDYLTLTCAEMA